MKFEILDSFKADYKRLSDGERSLFKRVLPDFVAACDRYATDPAAGCPGALRIKGVEGAPGVMEMTWSFAGPEGRATFEWVEIDGSLAVRWRRIGGHGVFRKP